MRDYSLKPWIYEFGVQDEFSVNAYGAGNITIVSIPAERF